MGVRQTLNQAMQTQPAQVIGHLPWGELVWGEAQEGRWQRLQIMMSKPIGQESKGDQRVEQGVHTGVNEAQRRHPLTGNLAGLVDLLKSIFTQEAIMAERLDVQEASVGLKADLPQGGQVLQPFAYVEVARIVDRRLGAQRTTFFVVLLDTRMFVVHVQGGRDPFGDDPGPKAAWTC
jgi:hypothetical protein